MLKKAFSKGFDPSRAAFFMPSGTGPCRFGQYNVFHKKVLEKAGFADVPVFAPNQDERFDEALSAVSGDFALHAWRGIVAIELLTKCLHESRPYEVEKGAADALYQTHLANVVNALRGRNGGIDQALVAARRGFAELPRRDERKPLIGVVGEIFVRSNRFSNEEGRSGLPRWKSGSITRTC
jgi:predicted nucleotide-binding protein (sugar kinase/HSP70/actin superfamily)